jgi:hypothetical protein
MKLRYWILVGFILSLFLTELQAEEAQKTPITDTVKARITAAKDWAVKSGVEFKAQQIKNMDETRDALKKDWSWSEGGRFTYPLKNAWEDARAQVRKDSVTVKGYWQNIADALGSLAPKKENN